MTQDSSEFFTNGLAHGFRLTQEPLFPMSVTLGKENPVTLIVHANGSVEGNLDAAEQALSELRRTSFHDVNMGFLVLLPGMIRAERAHRRAVAEAYPS